METLNNHQSEKEVTLSLAAKNYDGKTVIYKPTTIKTDSLESILKSHNYSPISWHGNYRDTENFKLVTGFCVDSDHGMTIEQALDKLKQLGLNYFLITTRSHQLPGKGDRFRIYIPFSKTIYSYNVYRKIIDVICTHFPQSDNAVFDGARQLYGSPDTATYHSHWDGKDFDVAPMLVAGEWDSSLRMIDGHKNQFDIRSFKEKTSICCPFHNDKNASAFIEYSDKSKNHFIHCSSCDRPFWMIKEPLSMEGRCKEFYSLGTGFHQLSITRGEFSMLEIGDKKIYSLVDVKTKEDKEAVYRWLMKNHHFPDMTLVEQIGDLNAKGSYFEPLVKEGMVRVHHGAIPVKDVNNDLIEGYLKDTFGDYAPTIKQWMSVFVHDNYRKLPFLILTGERGAGKNTFAELIGEIYKPLTMSWSGRPGSFTPENEMKLLVADETASEDPKQYLELKRLSGSQDLPVNKKFKQHYQVRNNINVIILSNKPYPIQVEREELPTSERDNQFFVYKMKKNYVIPDASFREKLKNALGHYIRTELKTVYDGLKLNEYRYSISVPITDYEKEIFGASATAEEQFVDNIILKFKEAYNGMIPSYEPFFKKGLVPMDLIEDTITKVDKNKVVKLLRSEGYLTSGKVTRDAINKDRKYCYTATAVLMAYMQS